jgi:CubicO group peptidase (beta-lactamase class C family)
MKSRVALAHASLLPLLLASAILSSCASAGPKLKSGLSFPELEATLDRKLPAAVGRRVPAVQVALVEGGRIVYEKAFGLADRESGRKADASTLFQVASISKSVTAWGALRLAQEGRLDLDAPVMAQEGRWKLPPSSFDAGGVTPRRLLSHTAGLAAFGFPGVSPDQRLPSLEESLSGNNEGKGRREPSRELRLVAAPGSAFSYTGGGYTLLQLLIEERSGQDFAAYMRDSVLLPSGMASSSFDYSPAMAPVLASPYDFFGKRLPNYLYTEKAAAGLYTRRGPRPASQRALPEPPRRGRGGLGQGPRGAPHRGRGRRGGRALHGPGLLPPAGRLGREDHQPLGLEPRLVLLVRDGD